ncbi:MAG: putative metal-binding motif-containing protein [Candidatus Calescibacterium sp.]|nr:putative metal-binding motif-containing protein [Candidatus Calescibacterium sp.]
MKITNKFKNLLVLLAFVVLFVQYSCVVRGKEGDFRMKVRAVFIKEDVERIKRSNLVLKVIVLEGQIPSEPIVDEEIYEQIRYGELGGKKFMERVTSFLLTTDQLKKCDNFYIWKVAGEEADLNCEKAVLIGNIDKQTEFKAVEGENLYYVDFSIPARDEKIYYIKIHTEDGGKIVKTFSRKFNYIPSMTAWVKLDINPTLFFFDFDGDTYPSGVSIYGINSFPNYVTEGQLKYSQQNGVPLFDCNDLDKNIHPEAQDACGDGIDSDCDGSDGFFVYEDKDQDGFASSSAPVCVLKLEDSTLKPIDLIFGFGDCDDSRAEVFPTAPLNCLDNFDNDCDGKVEFFAYRDLDGDKYSPNSVSTCVNEISYGLIAISDASGTNDCDDTSSETKPGAAEFCNFIDDNCNGQIDEGVLLTFYIDSDGDGYGSPSPLTQGCVKPNGYVMNSFDCNDSSSNVKPGAVEIINGVDDNCNGLVDEGAGLPTFYRDLDGDGFGNPASSIQAASQPPGYVSNALDCDDTSPAINPGTVWYSDMDGDGYSSGVTQLQCMRPLGYKLGSELVSTSGDCNDGDSRMNPGTRWYLDGDVDGYYPVGGSSISCLNPYAPNNATYVAIPGGDCNDNSSSVYPGAALNCNNALDEDCSGHVEMWYYEDQDGDGWTTPVSQCANVMPLGYTPIPKPADCNDNSSSVYPGAALNCNDVLDNDCSGNVESWGYTDVDGDLYAPNNVSVCVDLVIYPGMITVGSQLGLGDCNDSAVNINPSIPDNTCDGIDNNCNFYFDENTSPCYSPSLTVYSWGVSYATLRWEYPVQSSNVASFVLERSNDGVYFTQITFLPPSVTHYVDYTYSNMSKFYRVYAKNTTGSGPFSNVVSVEGFGAFAKSISGVGNDIAYGIVQVPLSLRTSLYLDGGYLIVGTTTSFGAGNEDIMVTKIHPSGATIYVRTLGGANIDRAYHITPAVETGVPYIGFLISGETYSFGGNCGGNCSDMLFVRFGADGSATPRFIGGSLSDIAFSSLQDYFGMSISYVVVGETYSFGQTCGGTCSDMMIVKLSNAFSLSLALVIGGAQYDSAKAVVETSDGGYLVVGKTNSFGAGGYDIFAVKLTQAFGLVWAKTIGSATDDIPEYAIPTSDGGFIIVGASGVSPNRDVLITKIQSNGTVSWSRLVGGSGDDIAKSISPTKDGKYIVVGETSSFSAGKDIYLVKIDNSGNVEQTKTIGKSSLNEIGNFVIKNESGEILVVGTTNNFGNLDKYVLKLSEDGVLGCNENIQNSIVVSASFSENFPAVVSQFINPSIGTPAPSNLVQRPREYSMCYAYTPISIAVGGTGGDIPYQAVRTADDGLVVVGSTQISDSSGDMYILRFNSNLNLSWSKTLGALNTSDDARAVIQDSDGNFVIVGTYSPLLNRDAVVAKISSSGTTLWIRRIDYTTDDAGRGVVQTSDGGYLVLVRSNVASTSHDVILVKLDSNGNKIWAKRIYGSASDQPSSIIKTSDGYYIITGITQSFRVGSGNDGFIMKVDENGNLLWLKSIGGPQDDDAPSIVEAEDGNSIFLGSLRSSVGSDDYNIFFGKIDKDGGVIWKKVVGWGYSTSSHEYGHSISKTPDGNFIIVGRTDSIPPTSDIILIKFDTDGNILQMNLLGGGSNELGNSGSSAFSAGKASFVTRSDGKLILVASTDSFGNGLYDIYITEISENTCGLKNVQDIIVSAGGFDEFSTPLTADITVSVSVAPLTLSESSGGNVVGACGTLAPAPQLFADANENIFNYESRSDLFSGQRSSSGCSSFDLEAVVSIFVLLIVLRIRKLIYISQK